MVDRNNAVLSFFLSNPTDSIIFMIFSRLALPFNPSSCMNSFANCSISDASTMIRKNDLDKINMYANGSLECKIPKNELSK